MKLHDLIWKKELEKNKIDNTLGNVEMKIDVISLLNVNIFWMVLMWEQKNKQTKKNKNKQSFGPYQY